MTQPTQNNDDVESDPAKGDSDPANADGDRTDWSDEGGATQSGPATDTDAS